MSALWHLFRLILRDQRPAMLRGAALTLTVLLAGAALLGLSGWFITAAAAAGLAGLGAVFDVFRPSAMVRLLALGRAAARYGERVLTHDATLRALETLRLRLLQGYLRADWQRAVRLRGAQALNRLTADVDALDGVPLRLVLPLAAGLATVLTVFAAVWALSGLQVAACILVGHLAAASLVLWRAARRAAPVSRRAEQAAQAFRSRLIDLIAARRDLAVHGRLVAQAGAVAGAEDRRRALRHDLDRTEAAAGAALSAAAGLVAAGALWLGMEQAAAGTLSPAIAAMGFFIALALTEALAPLRRAAADLGRMAEAARRIERDLRPRLDRTAPAGRSGTGGTLAIGDLRLARPGGDRMIVSGLSLTVEPGESVALTGASGSGKSTLLLAVAGLLPVAGGKIVLGGLPVGDWDEPALREALTLVPQRSRLMAGTVAEALRLGSPGVPDSDLWAALQAVRLEGVIHARGGLELRLGPRGDGLSGGEAQRLVLARALLRRPRFLLLDEPVEGLDTDTARAVMRGIRVFLPDAAILTASHRAEETDMADRKISLR